MRRIICILLTLYVLFCFSSCYVNRTVDMSPSNASDIIEQVKASERSDVTLPTLPLLPDEILYEDENYRISRINGRCYLLFSRNETYDYDDTTEIIKDKSATKAVNDIRPTVTAARKNNGFGLTNNVELTNSIEGFFMECDTVEELIDKVTVTGLSKSEVSAIWNLFGRGRYSEVCDFGRMLIPVHPTEYQCLSVQWPGSNFYTYKLDTVHPDLKDATLHIGYQDMLENSLAKIPDETYKLSKRPDVIFYGKQYGEDHYQYSKYEYVSGDTLYTVFELYYKDKNLPAQIDVFWSIGDINFHYEIGITIDWEGPTDAAWLNQFSVDIYVREE